MRLLMNGASKMKRPNACLKLVSESKNQRRRRNSDKKIIETFIEKLVYIQSFN